MVTCPTAVSALGLQLIELPLPALWPLNVISLIAICPVCSAVCNSHTHHANFQVLQASPPPQALCTLSNNQLHKKGLWAGKHVSSPTTWPSHIEHKSKRREVKEGEKIQGCLLEFSTRMHIHKSKVQRRLHFIFLPSFPSIQCSQHQLYTHSHTLLTRSPFAALQVQLPNAAGDGQCLLLLKSPIVSCSTYTTSPPFLCLLIPGIRRHGWVMTEMISLSASPSITPC